MRKEIAKNYFMNGYACSVSVALAFKDLVSISELELEKIALPFGGGFGRLRHTCGAVTGMGMIIGLLFTDPNGGSENKLAVYEMVQTVAKRFEEKHQTIICRELLQQVNVTPEVGGAPEARTPAYYQKRACATYCETAAEVLEQFLKEKGVL